jgi:DNA modification methylase
METSIKEHTRMNISSGPKEIWPIDRLKPHPENARTHSEEQIAQLVASFKEYGITHPILVDENDTILAGHGKWVAARQGGWREVPVIVIGGLTEIAKRAYLITDNQLALNADWNEEKLRSELEALEKELFHLPELGFSPQELDRILFDLKPESLVDEDAVPETPRLTVTVPGDLWVLGRHRLLTGDATKSDNYERLMPGQGADMVFSDFPYNVKYKQARGGKQVRTIANDDLGAAFEQFLQAACVQILAVTRGAVYLCMSSSELHTLHKAFTAAGGHWSTFVIWDKGHFTLGRSDMQRAYEPILYGWKEGQEHYWCGARNEGDVWLVPKPQANRLHPTMKPVALIERAIRNSSRRGDLVLDPFGGSGSTLIACEKTGRAARVMELEAKYVDVIIERWEAYTGQKAQLESDGWSFAAVAEERLRQAA